ncbi:MAG: hypothetical protein AB1349_06885 [Elusimicrobiota bacterium]
MRVVRNGLETFQTSDNKIFAGGDIINDGLTVVHAVTDGKKAAIGIKNYLTSTTK